MARLIVLLLGWLLVVTGAVAEDRASSQQHPLAGSMSLRFPALKLRGTGFYVNDDGWVLTAEHVVSTCRELSVHRPGWLQRGRVVARDAESDLALVKIERTLGMPVTFFGRDRVELGSPTFIGGYHVVTDAEEAGGFAFANGIVADGPDLGRGTGTLRLFSPGVFGDSGAPILDGHGQVIGLVTSKIAPENTGPRDLTPRPSLEESLLGTSSRAIRDFLTANQVEHKVAGISGGTAERERTSIQRVRLASVAIMCRS